MLNAVPGPTEKRVIYERGYARRKRLGCQCEQHSGQLLREPLHPVMLVKAPCRRVKEADEVPSALAAEWIAA